MKIRLMGTADEIQAVLPVLEAVLDVHETSGAYANRGSSRLSRIYLEVGGPRVVRDQNQVGDDT